MLKIALLFEMIMVLVVDKLPHGWLLKDGINSFFSHTIFKIETKLN